MTPYNVYLAKDRKRRKRRKLRVTAPVSYAMTDLDRTKARCPAKEDVFTVRLDNMNPAMGKKALWTESMVTWPRLGATCARRTST